MKRRTVVVRYSSLKMEPAITLPENEAEPVGERQAVFDLIYGANHAQVLTIH